MEFRFVTAELECGSFVLVADVQMDGDRPPTKDCPDCGQRRQTYRVAPMGGSERPACHGIPGTAHHRDCG